MYIALSLLVSCLMMASAALKLALWQFWMLYPIYCFVIFKAVDGIPFWRLNESKLANFLTKMFFFGGLPWYYLIIIIVNILWWQADSKVWLYHFADSAWRLLAPAFYKPDLVFFTLINTEYADFSQKAKLIYSLFLLFFLLISPFFFGIYSWRRSCGAVHLRNVKEVTSKDVIVYSLMLVLFSFLVGLGPINWDFSGCGAKCADAGARMAARGSYSLIRFYILYPGLMGFLLSCLYAIFQLVFEPKEISGDWSEL